MYKYILKRLLMMIPVLLGVTFIVFFILNLSPGDPAAMILGDQASAEALEKSWDSMIRWLSVTADTLSTWYRETWEHPIRMT